MEDQSDQVSDPPFSSSPAPTTNTSTCLDQEVDQEVDQQSDNEGSFDLCKLFVGGLGNSTTRETFEKYFSKFGEIESIKFMSNYGFVTFSSPAPIPEILRTRWHVVDGRTVDVKRSRRNESPAFPGSTPIQTKKIFVGNLKRGMTSSALQEYFGRFSPVSNVNMIMKHNKPRGFAFLTFGSDDDCRSVLNSGPHVIGGQEVICKPATPALYRHERDDLKIFIGGLPASVDTPHLREVFSQFGSIRDATVVFNREQRGVSRCFGFVSYFNREDYDATLAAQPIHIKGKLVELKPAEPRISNPGKGDESDPTQYDEAAMHLRSSFPPHMLAAKADQQAVQQQNPPPQQQLYQVTQQQLIQQRGTQEQYMAQEQVMQQLKDNVSVSMSDFYPDTSGIETYGAGYQMTNLNYVISQLRQKEEQCLLLRHENLELRKSLDFLKKQLATAFLDQNRQLRQHDK